MPIDIHHFGARNGDGKHVGDEREQLVLLGLEVDQLGFLVFYLELSSDDGIADGNFETLG